MPRLRVPSVQVFADFFEICNADGFAAEGEDAPREIEEIKDVQILPGGERSANALINGRLVVWPGSLGGEKYLGDPALAGLMERAFDISKGRRARCFPSGTK